MILNWSLPSPPLFPLEGMAGLGFVSVEDLAAEIQNHNDSDALSQQIRELTERKIDLKKFCSKVHTLCGARVLQDTVNALQQKQKEQMLLRIRVPNAVSPPNEEGSTFSLYVPKECSVAEVFERAVSSWHAAGRVKLRALPFACLSLNGWEPIQPMGSTISGTCCHGDLVFLVGVARDGDDAESSSRRAAGESAGAQALWSTGNWTDPLPDPDSSPLCRPPPEVEARGGRPEARRRQSSGKSRTSEATQRAHELVPKPTRPSPLRNEWSGCLQAMDTNVISAARMVTPADGPPTSD